MKNTFVVMAVVLSLVGFSTLSFAGLLKAQKSGKVRKTGQSIYKTRRTQAVVVKPAPVLKTEVKVVEKKKE